MAWRAALQAMTAVQTVMRKVSTAMQVRLLAAQRMWLLELCVALQSLLQTLVQMPLQQMPLAMQAVLQAALQPLLATAAVQMVTWKVYMATPMLQLMAAYRDRCVHRAQREPRMFRSHGLTMAQKVPMAVQRALQMALQAPRAVLQALLALQMSTWRF